MRWLLLFAVVAVVVVSVVTGVVVGAETPEPTEADFNETVADAADRFKGGDCPEPEPIDSKTALCSAELKDGKAVLVFKSDRLQRIQLTDAGMFMKGGEVPQTRVTLRPDEVQTVRWSVTEHRGFAGVSVNTRETLYAIPLDEPTTLVGGPWSENDVQIAALSGAASIGVASIVIVFRAVTGRAEKPKRLA
jgi:hypothetical protein